MSPLITLKDPARELQIFQARAAVAIGLVLVLTLGLTARMFYLQVREYEHFKTQSDDNRVNIFALAPTRGLIFDRNGVILAQNTPTYSLEVVPETITDMDVMLADLRDIIDISDADERRFRSQLKKKRGFESIPLRFRLSAAEVAEFSVNRHFFPGVDVHARPTRNYPHGPLAVHIVGYVGRIDERELQRIDAANYRGTSHIGKTGVEQSYEKVLHGTVGYEHVETNALGRTLRTLSRNDPVPGRNLYLTIDASLQAVAEQSLGDNNGAVVAIEPATGALLAFVSMPGFDPNLFVNGIDQKNYRRLLSSPSRPLFNRALNGQYPPGSTIKPFIGLAALDRNIELTRKDAWCPGWFSLPGLEHRYRDWKKGGHGRVGFKRAIVESCDVFFYQLALGLGIDGMHDFLVGFGFGQPTGVDLRNESSGLLPSIKWKRMVRNQPWYPSETLISGIGQGFTLATPLQLASATATLSTRGKRVRPQLVLRRADSFSADATALVPETSATVALREVDWQRIVKAMVDVVHGPRGTARRVGVGAGYRIAGKTGTAQVFGVGQEEKYEEEKVAKHLRDHGLFISFAPADEPRIAVAVLVENGGSGSRSAAPIARKVLDHYLSQGSGPEDNAVLASRTSSRLDSARIVDLPEGAGH